MNRRKAGFFKKKFSSAFFFKAFDVEKDIKMFMFLIATDLILAYTMQLTSYGKIEKPLIRVRLKEN